MGGDPTGISFFISILMVFVVMYFLIMRPQAKRQKERTEMLKKVTKGDRVLTSGGLIGNVVATKTDDVLLVRFGDNRPMEVSRQAVTGVLGASTETAME
jgi:preprotein translocase subunit YajC